jgi:hypothetical protein
MDVLSRMRGPHRRGVGAGRTYSYETVQMNVIAATAPAADFPVTVTAFHAARVGDRDGAGARGGPGASGGGLLVETGVEQRRVLAGRNAVHDAVGAHHRGRCGLVLPQLAAEASGTVAGSTSPATSSDSLVSRIAASRSRCLGPGSRAAPGRLAGLRGVWRRVGFRTSTSLEMAAP